MRRSRGFTLPELLVVLGVIAILLAMLLPSVARARGSAQQVVCLSILRQYAAAATMYRTQFHTYLPVKIGIPPGPTPSGVTLPPASAPYANWYEIPQFREFLGITRPAYRVPAGLICPRAVLAGESGSPEGFVIGRSYGANAEGLPWLSNPPTYYTGVRDGRLRHPEQKLMIADATDWVIKEETSSSYLTYGESYSPSMTGITAFRHVRGANVLFFDGHAVLMGQEEIINNNALWRLMD